MKIADAIAALNAAREALRENTVDTTTLIERVGVCEQCPMKKHTQGLKSNVGQILATLAIKHQVPESISGFMCGVCGCPLSLLTSALVENLHKDSPQEAAQRPLGCWMLDKFTKTS
jgi:hypothetical protein